MKENSKKATKKDLSSNQNNAFNISPPKETCKDKKCPFHGSLKLRGMIFTGNIIKTDLHRTATIEFERQFFIPKYERKEVRFSRIKAHNPSCISAKIGELVKIVETRPLSKTKNFVIVEVIRK